MLEVKQIKYEDCLPFILQIHYARRIPSIQYAYGLFLDDTLIGVVTYGQPASASLCKGVAGEEYRHQVLELNRLVLSNDEHGKNFASMLVGRSLRLLPQGYFIVSYADWEGWGHTGYIYQATNWMYTGMTKSRTDKYSSAGHSRHYAEGETRRQYRTSKHRYVFITGGKIIKKRLKKLLRYPILPYPKGDNVNYDTSNPKPVCEKLNKVIDNV